MQKSDLLLCGGRTLELLCSVQTNLTFVSLFTDDVVQNQPGSKQIQRTFSEILPPILWVKFEFNSGENDAE